MSRRSWVQSPVWSLFCTLTISLGNRALHFPFRIQGLTNLLQSLCRFEHLTKSSTVILKRDHQLSRALHLSHTSQVLRSGQRGGGASGIVLVGGTYSGFFWYSSSHFSTSSSLPSKNSPLWTASRYSTIAFWKSDSGSIILSRISCGERAFFIHNKMCKCKVSLPCCSTVP